MSGIPAVLRMLATLLIVAQQPDGSVLVTADSRVGLLHSRNGVPEPITYRDDGCKIALINHVVFLYAGEPRHTAEITARPGHVRTIGWDGTNLAAELIRRHHGRFRTQQELDALALRWAQSVEDAERTLEQNLGHDQAAGSSPTPLPNRVPLTRFQPTTGIFLTSFPHGPVLHASISIRQQKLGTLIERGSWPAAQTSTAPRTHLAFYGDSQAQSTATAAFAQLEAKGTVSPITFGQLAYVNDAVANKVETVAPPFDQIQLHPGAWPAWVQGKEHCR